MIWFIIWIIGFLATIFGDAYFTRIMKDDGNFFFACIFWPLFLPFLGVWSLYEYIYELGEKHEEKRKKLEKIRVAEEKLQERLMAEAEQEVDTEMLTIQNRSEKNSL